MRRGRHPGDAPRRKRQRQREPAKGNNRVRGDSRQTAVEPLQRQFQIGEQYFNARRAYEQHCRLLDESLAGLLALDHVPQPPLLAQWRHIGPRLGNHSLGDGAPWGAALGFWAGGRPPEEGDWIDHFIWAPEVLGRFVPGRGWVAAPVPNNVLDAVIGRGRNTVSQRRRRGRKRRRGN